MPTDAQRETVKDAFLELDSVEAIEDEFKAGFMGEQIGVLLTGVNEFDFSIYVEDIEMNMSWCIVKLSSGVYSSEFDVKHDDTNTLVATVEVDRFP